MLYSLYFSYPNSPFVRYRLLIGNGVTESFRSLIDIDSHLQNPKFMHIAIDQSNPQSLNQQFLKQSNYTLLLTTDQPPTFEYLTLHYPELLL